MFTTKLKTGDQVIVISGKHKGAAGKIKKMLAKKTRCIVENVAMVKKHVRATKQDEKSQIISKESSIAISNVAFYDEKNKQPVKLGYKKDDQGNKVRFNKKTGDVV